MENPNRLFIAEVKKRQAEKKLTYKDIGKKTGYKKGTIGAFMCGARKSNALKTAIASALDIEL